MSLRGFLNFKMLSTYEVNIVTCGSISWLIFNLVPIFVNLFNLIQIFIIFVQFSPNFVSIQNDQIYYLYKCYIEFFLLKFTFILNISFIIFYQT